MRAVDGNVVVRSVLYDETHPQGVPLSSKMHWVSHVALYDAMLSLTHEHGYGSEAIAGVVERLLCNDRFILEEPIVVQATLDAFRKKPAAGFFDCFKREIASARGHATFVTLDE